MKLFEYQAKKILASCGVPVPRSILIKKVPDLKHLKEGIYPSGYVVKAQILTGGRGKAGGVKLVKTAKEAAAIARDMLGATLETHQSGGAALKIVAVLVAEKITIEREFYTAITLNRRKAQSVLLASPAGGTEVEETAAPGELQEIPIDPWMGINGHQLKELALGGLQIPSSRLPQFVDLTQKLIKIYQSREFSLLEINPLALTPQGFFALDAKINLEENALFRQPDNLVYAKQNRILWGSLEQKAKKLGVSYIPIGGQIGCLVNGAGLAMATMDLIQSRGKKPANFLDVGGGANKDQVRGAFEILLADRTLSAIFVNIFGGIMRCDLIAEALVEANKKTKLRVPLVARLLGNNVDQARDILSKARLAQVEVFDDLANAVASVCQKGRDKSNGSDAGLVPSKTNRVRE